MDKYRNHWSLGRPFRLSDFEVMKAAWEQLKTLQPYSKEYREFREIFKRAKKRVVIDGGKVE